MQVSNCIKSTRNAKYYAWMGCFDVNGRYYEQYVEEVVLSNLPESMLRDADFGHDITVQILPKSDIIIFAKNAHDMDKYKEIMGADCAKEMLDAFSKYNDPKNGRFWLTYDF